MELHDAIMESVLSVLSEKIDPKILKKADRKSVRKKLYQKLTNEVFYILLKEGKVNLPSGFGTVMLKGVREKEKKIYDQKEKIMITRKIGGHKVIYRPGLIVKQFL